jgi:hypothetical protein
LKNIQVELRTFYTNTKYFSPIINWYGKKEISMAKQSMFKCKRNKYAFYHMKLNSYNITINSHSWIKLITIFLKIINLNAIINQTGNCKQLIWLKLTYNIFMKYVNI